MIEVKHLDITFNNQVIFKNANFKASSGIITGIIGKSGCGKTTFLKSLLYQYKNQVLYVDRILITNENKNIYLSNNVSYIDQFGSFFENMKISQHFEFISKLINKQYNSDEMLEMLHLVGLDDINISCYPSSLSIGQRKRLLIALALFKDASIVIIDEPTASLDKYNKDLIIDLLKELKRKNKYIIITTHDDYLIKQCDVIYEIKDKQLYCKDEIENDNNSIKFKDYLLKKNHKYFIYKNKRQWFQFVLVMLLGFIMTITVSTNICDSVLQERQLESGVERANKAEMYTAKINDAYIGNDSYYIGDQDDNLDINDNELEVIKSIDHVNNIYPFDVFNSINQMSDITTSNVVYNGNTVEFDYFKGGSPLVAPYYSFQNIKVDGKNISGNAISLSLANKLGIDKDKKNFQISLEVYVPVQQYSYVGELNQSGLKANMSQVLTKKVKLDIIVDDILSVDDYYNEFLSESNIILMPNNDFYNILKQYNNQTPDDYIYAKELNANIIAYHSKNYLIEVDRINNLKTVREEILKISNNLVTYDQYNSVIDTTDVYKEERKNRYIFIIMVVLVSIVLYAMVQINTLDDQKNEIRLLKINGINNKIITSFCKENNLIQLILTTVLSMPGFIVARKMGYFAINSQNIRYTFLFFMTIQICFSIIVYFFYCLYVKCFIKKVSL